MNKLITFIIVFCCITNMFAQTDKIARKRSNQSQSVKTEMTAAQLYSEGVKQFNIFWDSNSQTARSKAISYFERAEKKGNVNSLYYLGRLCGGNEDDKQTGYWTKGADLEDVDCMRELGYKLLNHGYSLRDTQVSQKAKGFQLLESASMKGDYEAKLYLGDCYFTDNQDEKALKNWLSVANNSTDEDLKARACREIGDYYFGSIRGRVIDYKKGIEWYEKSASYNVYAGNSTRSVLTRIYFGAGTRPEYKDLDRCKYWCNRIIARGLRFQIDKEILEYFGL